jgi:hypothetical protein
MHTPAQEARLRANKNAYANFTKFKDTYVRYAKDVKDSLGSKYPALSLESRVSFVRQMILELDVNIYGLANVNMTATDVADCIARLVVGHEN